MKKIEEIMLTYTKRHSLERQQVQLALAPHTREKHECTVVIKLSYCRLMKDNYKLTVGITDS